MFLAFYSPFVEREKISLNTESSFVFLSVSNSMRTAQPFETFESCFSFLSLLENRVLKKKENAYCL